MWQLQLPEYNFKIKKNDDTFYIFDFLRKKYIILTPEEWVRQNFIRYMVEEKKVPKTIIANEFSLKADNTIIRCDSVIFNRQGKPLALLEFKAPNVDINQVVFNQISRYNYILKVKYLIVSNGLKHFCCEIDYLSKTHKFLNEIPSYKEMKNSIF